MNKPKPSLPAAVNDVVNYSVQRGSLKSDFSTRNRERPAHVRDFDLNFGLHGLRHTLDTPGRREWATPLWQNGVYSGFMVMIVLSCLSVWYFNPEARVLPDSPWALLGWGLGGLLLTVILGTLAAGMMHRGRLIVDRNARCLRFHRSLLWPREVWCLPLDEIEALAIRNIQVSGIGTDNLGIGDSPHTYRIVVAELRDGRLASIAFDSESSLSTAIREALDPDTSTREDSQRAAGIYCG